MDDGIVLNIAEPSAQPSRRADKSKGGRWTDRVKARQASKRKNAGGSGLRSPRPPQVDAVELDDSPRPAKKPRESTSYRQNHVHEPDHPAKSTGTARPLQVISSLFTYNPKVDFEEAPVSQRVMKPSNAPLTDKSTFTGLGLDPLIVAHLQTKMNISTPTSIQREALPPLLSSSNEDTTDHDVFIQSQTGSGKTLSYLLPILQDLFPLSSLSYIDRAIGTLAIIIVPTRELAKQISDVLTELLSLRLRPSDENVDDTSPSVRLTRWLVSGLLIGGENRTHEKSRLRKGLPILVSTPGRLLDHLQNTSSFNVGKCRWLVLDEADRLMDLGFEESIKGILQALEGRRKLAVQAVEEGNSSEVGGWDWKRRRRTILCSATIKENVQHLAGTALVKPIIVKALETDNPTQSTDANTLGKTDTLPIRETFTPPSQLLQKYIVAPLKLRLVALIALLRYLLSQFHSRHGARVIVFLSCTDSVDYHWKLLGTSSIDDSLDAESEESGSENSDDEDEDDSERKRKTNTNEGIALTSPLLPQTSIYRLHGSLPLHTRQASLKGFAGSSSRSKDVKNAQEPRNSILLCTSVASRGLDLPLVRAVVQYDLPTEGGATEYVHRVGRTARVGKGGEAWSFVLPSEQAWVRWIEERMQDKSADSGREGGGGEEGGKKNITSLVPASVESVMRSGFGGKDKEFEERATQVQLAFERWVLKRKEHAELARRAFQAHMRAYATHPSDEKHMFHIRNLHIGHLAKAFALRDAPGSIAQKDNTKVLNNTKIRTKPKPKPRIPNKKLRNSSDSKPDKPHWRVDKNLEHDTTAEARMQKAVRKQGRSVKKGGVLMASGADEFQVGGGYDLEKLVSSV